LPAARLFLDACAPRNSFAVLRRGAKSSNFEPGGAPGEQRREARRLLFRSHMVLPAKRRRPFGEGGLESLEASTRENEEAIEDTGLARYYGSESDYAHLEPEARAAWLDDHRFFGTSPVPPERGDCLTWAMKHLEAAYAKSHSSARWRQIEQVVQKSGGKATVLARELKKDGWKALYFNPDVRHPADGDPEHTYTAKNAKLRRSYYGIRVDGFIVNYHPTAGGDTKLDRSGLAMLEKVPFFFGLSRGGKHTFAGHHGRVSELHWEANPDEKVIEERPLTKFPWCSGLILVPP
jgi:hypothetical protein